ncbi:MAG: Holliday junction branch migration protein RuvA [Candidatus Cyclobacteriaceae bacterium M2_1C_046]
MIAYIEGKITVNEPTHTIIDVNGIGYQLNISLNTFSAIKGAAKVKLHAYLHVKEDSHTLFGFHTLAEKRMFLSLLSISGVGPNTALMIQSSLPPEELQRAIISDDVRTIQSVKGVGAKTAQRIILELKDKIQKEEISGEITKPSHNTVRAEALSALTVLGINKSTAEKSIDSILKKTGSNISLEELIKQALKSA